MISEDQICVAQTVGQDLIAQGQNLFKKEITKTSLLKARIFIILLK